MTKKLPLVYFAFANDLDDHLASLKKESRAVFDCLKPLRDRSLIELHREESTSIDELYNDLIELQNRVVIFHFAGHADGTMLQLEQGNGQAIGLAKLLGSLPSLKLVFLNGCATQKQVKLLHDAGVPSVIATAVKISDEKATLLAEAFYKALANDSSIEQAFNSAQALIESKFEPDSLSFGTSRQPNFVFDEDTLQDDEFEWSLYIKTEARSDIEHWRLSRAIDSWILKLYDKDGQIKNLDNQTIEINALLVQRDQDIDSCDRCETTFINYQKAEYNRCPICGFNQFKTQSISGFLPENTLKTVVSAEQAIASVKAGKTKQSKVSSILEKLNYRSYGKASVAEQKQSEQTVVAQKLLLPVFIIKFATRTSFKAERGELAHSESGLPNIKWQAVNDKVNLKGSFIYPAFVYEHKQSSTSFYDSAKINQGLRDIDVEHQSTDTKFNAPLALPMQKDHKDAFAAFLQHHDEEQLYEIRELLGGIEQRAIHTERRFASIDIRCFYLPVWALHQQSGDPNPTIVNAISGEISCTNSGIKPHLPTGALLTMKNERNTQQSDEKPNTSVSVFAGAGIGIMVGLLLGLAAPQSGDAKSVVAIFIGAVGVGLAALLGLNDRHFSVAKGLRIGSFGIAVSLCALVGIFIRDNGLLTPSLQDRVDIVRDVFPSIKDDRDIIALIQTSEDANAPVNILERKTALHTPDGSKPHGTNKGTNTGDTPSTYSPGYGPQPAAQSNSIGSIVSPRSQMFANFKPVQMCNDLYYPYNTDVDLKELYKRYYFIDNRGVLQLRLFISRLDANYDEKDRKFMLLLTRNVVCADREDYKRIPINSSQCKIFEMARFDNSKIREFFFANDYFKDLANKIEYSLGPRSLEHAYADLAHMLCTPSPLTFKPVE